MAAHTAVEGSENSKIAPVRVQVRVQVQHIAGMTMTGLLKVAGSSSLKRPVHHHHNQKQAPKQGQVLVHTDRLMVPVPVAADRIADRLVRHLCGSCCKSYTPPAAVVGLR